MASEPAAPASPLDYALAYAELGWRALPIKPGQKRPPMSSWQHAATTDAKVITNWYRGLYGGHGVGIATGAESGIWVLDVDTGPDKRGDDSMDVLYERHGGFPVTVTAWTGSGGRHYLFRWPTDGRVVRTRRELAEFDGLDVRGEGGQIVAAPTIHPNGQPYVWQIGASPWDIPVADAPEWLLELVCDPIEPPAREALPADRTPIDDGDSIAAWVNDTHTWDGLLGGDGWHPHAPHGAEQYWTRPGKEAREGNSAVLHLPDGPFVVFSTDASLGRFFLPWAKTRTGDGYAFSRFGYIAATRHHGDRSACARHYRHVRTSLAASATPNAPTSALAASVLPPVVIDAPPSADDSDWEEIDLGEIARLIRSGEYAPISPAVLAVEGAAPLFYSGRINSLFGESGGGKTWVALAAIAECARAGLRSLLIDYEDAAAGIGERLVHLGLADAEIALVDYVNPSTGLSFGVEHTAATLAGREYALVVIDSTGEAMAAGGINPNADEEVAGWFRIARHFTRIGGEPAVVILDHVPKDKEAPSAYAIGSQRKRAAVTGASYRVDTVQEFAKGKDGKLRLTVAKDRPGNRPRGKTAAMADIRTIGDTGRIALRFHITEAQAAEAKGEQFRPTVYMERVSRWVEANPGASRKKLGEGVAGKRDVVDHAVDVLIAEGWLEVVDGARGARCHHVRRPYREIEDATNRDVQATESGQTPDLCTYEPPMNPPMNFTGGDDLRTYAPPLTRRCIGGTQVEGDGPMNQPITEDNAF